jgi:hemolysin-activating ACP:hemolysin acyltransferase
LSKAPRFRTVRDENPNAALGRAVAYLMRKPNFENQRLGRWGRILVGQVNRNHYFFVIDEKMQVVGFAGWAMTDKEKALAWLHENKPLSFEDSKSGDSMIINAWAADTGEVNRFILKSLRQIAIDKNIYAKRFYSDGTTRVVDLNPNKFIEKHIKSEKKK